MEACSNNTRTQYKSNKESSNHTIENMEIEEFPMSMKIISKTQKKDKYKIRDKVLLNKPSIFHKNNFTI